MITIAIVCVVASTIVCYAACVVAGWVDRGSE